LSRHYPAASAAGGGISRAREYLTDTELQKLMKAAGDNRNGHRDVTMLLVAYRQYGELDRDEDVRRNERQWLGFAMRSCAASLIGMLLIVSSFQGAKAQQNAVLTYHGDENRSGKFVVPGLTWDKARSAHLDQMFAAHVAGHLYAQPLYWHAASSNSAMLLVASEDDIVQAFDATTGEEVWRRSVGRPVPASSLPCGNINPLGITGTPVIDPATQAIYFDAASKGPPVRGTKSLDCR
jgi:hypothetical protein